MRLRKIVTRLLVIVAAVAALLSVSAFGYFHYQAHVAKRMMQGVQRLQIGQSTEADVLPLVHRYSAVRSVPLQGGHGCDPDNCEYFFRITPLVWESHGPESHGPFVSRILESVFDMLNWESVNYLGMRAWFVTASVRLENGRVSEYAGSINVNAPCHKLLNASWSVAAEFPALGHHGEKWPNMVSDNLMIQWHSIISYESGEGLTSYLRPSATPEERQVAFNLNMDCLTRMGNGCFLLSDILPDGVRWKREHGQGLGWTGHACRGLKDPDLN